MKTWMELTPAERTKRLGDPVRWEKPRAAQDSWESDLLRRYHAGEPLTKDDCKRARRLLRELSAKS